MGAHLSAIRNMGYIIVGLRGYRLPTLLLAFQLSSSEAEKRVQWVRDTRKVLSPPEMINPDGSVYQDFFKPKKVIICASTSCPSSLQSQKNAFC